ncbi:MAG: flagellar hook-basal body complex protein FliE [Rhizomicrobium sp.]
MIVNPAAPIGQAAALAQLAVPPLPPPTPSQAPVSFAQMLAAGVDRVNADTMRADQMVRAFVLDDSVPVHQVTFALSQAQLSLDLMLQIRSRVLDAYQQLSNMQL